MDLHIEKPLDNLKSCTFANATNPPNNTQIFDNTQIMPEKSAELTVIEYTDDDRIKFDKDGKAYVKVENWSGSSAYENSTLFNIIKNSYNLELLSQQGILFDDIVKDVVKENNIANVNLVYANQKIILPQYFEHNSTLLNEDSVAFDEVIDDVIDENSLDYDGLIKDYETDEIVDDEDESDEPIKTDETIDTEETIEEPVIEEESDNEIIENEILDDNKEKTDYSDGKVKEALGYQDDNRIYYDKETNTYKVNVETWHGNNSENSTIQNIINNSYNLEELSQELSISETELAKELYNQIVELNDIKTWLPMHTGDVIILPQLRDDSVLSGYDVSNNETTEEKIEEQEPVEEETGEENIDDMVLEQDIKTLKINNEDGSYSVQEINAEGLVLSKIEYSKIGKLKSSTEYEYYENRQLKQTIETGASFYGRNIIPSELSIVPIDLYTTTKYKIITEYDKNSKKINETAIGYSVDTPILEAYSQYSEDKTLLNSNATVYRNYQKGIKQQDLSYNIENNKGTTSVISYDYNGNITYNENYSIIHDKDNNVVGKERFSNINGEINNFKQGKIGDCWLLSGLQSLVSSQKGRELLDKHITYNDDRSYVVNFTGIDKNIKITQKQLEEAISSGKYSNGDDDVIIWELAFESVRNAARTGVLCAGGSMAIDTSLINTEQSPLEGGYFQEFIYFLSGNLVQVAQGYNYKYIFTEENAQNIAAEIYFMPYKQGGQDLCDVNGNYIFTVPTNYGHAFSLVGVKNGNAIISNPHDSSIQYEISMADLEKYSAYAQYIHL